MFRLDSNATKIPLPEFAVIQYPGIVRNMDRALETLGGMAQLSQSHFSGRPLEIRHTPDNPYTSCLSSEKKIDASITSGTLRLVVKIRRKKSNPKEMISECLGLVNYLYTFETICDFQYLPVRKRNQSEGYDDLIPRLIPTDLPSALCWWERADSQPGHTPLFLPPYQFSRYNTPSTKILCRETDFSLEKTRKKTGHGQNLRVERKSLSVTVMSLDTFPAAPSADAVTDAELRCKNEEPHRMLDSLFTERPMWTRVAILYRTGLDDNLLRSLLQKFAFYIQSGPWGRLWCRFGYDPRKDLDSKKYQTLMVSFRQHTKIPERQRLKVSADRSGIIDNSAPINFCYQQGRLPRVRQMWYCVCDVKLPLSDVLLKKDYSTCTDPATHGWISPTEMEELRERVKEDVRKTSEEMDEYEDVDMGEDF